MHIHEFAAKGQSFIYVATTNKCFTSIYGDRQLIPGGFSFVCNYCRFSEKSFFFGLSFHEKKSSDSELRFPTYFDFPFITWNIHLCT